MDVAVVAASRTTEHEWRFSASMANAATGSPVEAIPFSLKPVAELLDVCSTPDRLWNRAVAL